MSRYVKQNHDRWYILSAKHGLLDPKGPDIEPYDETLRNFGKGEKRAWAEEVFEEFRQQESLGNSVRVVFHAGKDYYGELAPLIEETGTTVEIPTEGLGIGAKLSWYKRRL